MANKKRGVVHNSLLQFKNNSYRKKYEEFYRTAQAPIGSAAIICGQVGMQCIYSCIAYANQPDRWGIQFAMIAMITLSLAAGLCSIALRVLGRKKVDKNGNCKDENKKDGATDKYLHSSGTAKDRPTKVSAFAAQILESAFLLLVVCYSALRLWMRASQGACEADEFIARLNCNPAALGGGLPEETLVGIFLLPLMIPAALPSLDWNIALVSWLIVLISTLTSALYINAMRLVICILIVWMPMSLIVLFESRRRCIYAFISNLELQALLAENLRMADEMHATELRHMIGNVAHDLKTPLAAFVNGTEFVMGLLSDMRQHFRLAASRQQAQHHSQSQTQSEHVQTEMKALEDLMALVGNMEDAIKSCRNINSFMLMTINRCIDYTKASNGMKLTPRLETVHFLEALQLPLKIMQDMQQKVAINLVAVPLDLCTHVTTDLQWLQENVLCLLSNAAKYSNHGQVTVAITLCFKDGLPMSYAEAAEPVARSRSRSAAAATQPATQLAHGLLVQHRKATRSDLHQRKRKEKGQGERREQQGERHDRARRSLASSTSSSSYSSSSSSPIDSFLGATPSPAGASASASRDARAELERKEAESDEEGGEDVREEGEEELKGAGSLNRSSFPSFLIPSSSSAPSAPSGLSALSGLTSGTVSASTASASSMNVLFLSSETWGDKNGEDGKEPKKEAEKDAEKEGEKEAEKEGEKQVDGAKEGQDGLLGGVSAADSTTRTTKSTTATTTTMFVVGDVGAGADTPTAATTATTAAAADATGVGECNRSVEHPGEGRAVSATVQQHSTRPPTGSSSRGGSRSLSTSAALPTSTPTTTSNPTAASMARGLSVVELISKSWEDMNAPRSGAQQQASASSSFRVRDTSSLSVSTNTSSNASLTSISSNTSTSRELRNESNGSSAEDTEEEDLDRDDEDDEDEEDEEKEEEEDDMKQYVLIEIEDTGIGMSEEVMRNLFNPFKQAQRRAGGTGLGLYSLAKRIEALRGKFGVTKRKDGTEGSLLWFAIPYSPDFESANHALEEAELEKQEQAEAQAEAEARLAQVQEGGQQEVQEGWGENEAGTDGDRHYGAGYATAAATATASGTGAAYASTSVEEVHAEEGGTQCGGRVGGEDMDVDAASMSVSLSLSASISSGGLNAMGQQTISESGSAALACASGLSVISGISGNAASRPLKPLRILVADDALPIRKMASMNLHRHGHEVTLVENGFEAVRVVRKRQWRDVERWLVTQQKQNKNNKVVKTISADERQEGVKTTAELRESVEIQKDEDEGKEMCQPFDLILMDLQMPIMDGLEATANIRRYEAKLISQVTALKDQLQGQTTKRKGRVEKGEEKKGVGQGRAEGDLLLAEQEIPPRVCILGFSANSDSETSVAAQLAGVDGFMGKPFTMEQFNKAYRDAKRATKG